ncbi:hypothetical protein M430DRAFT_16263 [Amorphotheca resinae ATCC 22711]|uniref:Uncharacterized protein n=1 Tax=Amorphotheca resinae ATCC 22711 TaxID=857342 RepID=A0A2T3BB32_AMORE|nr:hypothetical protein M430DRAFT_16263 [Amorphotheca resinae ATCC 22711]PSS25547.1 hypothetical protein M430DRAFT_16263 [Amorphotheca resinae ATCC 22711]
MPLLGPWVGPPSPLPQNWWPDLLPRVPTTLDGALLGPPRELKPIQRSFGFNSTLTCLVHVSPVTGTSNWQPSSIPYSDNRKPTSATVPSPASPASGFVPVTAIPSPSSATISPPKSAILAPVKADEESPIKEEDESLISQEAVECIAPVSFLAQT